MRARYSQLTAEGEGGGSHVGEPSHTPGGGGTCIFLIPGGEY